MGAPDIGKGPGPVCMCPGGMGAALTPLGIVPLGINCRPGGIPFIPRTMGCCCMGGCGFIEGGGCGGCDGRGIACRFAAC